LAIGLGVMPSSAQTYPVKPIRIIVPTSPGGITDTLARALAQRLTESLGQQVIVENRPAGAGHIGMEFVAKAAPDGYTLVVAADASFVVNPHLYSKLSYDPMGDFVPISGLVVSPQALVLHPSVPANTFQSLSRSPRASRARSIMDLRHRCVQHYAGAPAITDSLGGHIQMMIVAMGCCGKHRDGRLLLAIGNRERVRSIPTCRRCRRAGARLRGGLVVRSRGPRAHRLRSSRS
jgi:tripartite-type tricarboxylate transporter receptor subunit TctC